MKDKKSWQYLLTAVLTKFSTTKFVLNFDLQYWRSITTFFIIEGYSKLCATTTVQTPDTNTNYCKIIVQQHVAVAKLFSDIFFKILTEICHFETVLRKLWFQSVNLIQKAKKFNYGLSAGSTWTINRKELYNNKFNNLSRHKKGKVGTTQHKITKSLKSCSSLVWNRGINRLWDADA